MAPPLIRFHSMIGQGQPLARKLVVWQLRTQQGTYKRNACRIFVSSQHKKDYYLKLFTRGAYLLQRNQLSCRSKKKGCYTFRLDKSYK